MFIFYVRQVPLWGPEMCLGQHLARSKAGYLIKNGISPLNSVQFLLKRGLALFMLIANYNALLSPLFSKVVLSDFVRH